MSEFLRILLVEDSPEDADIIRQLLPQTGPARFQVEAVGRVAAAVVQLQAEEFDLVLLDLGLAGNPGLPGLRQLCAAAPDVPVIALSGTDDQESGVAAVRAGAQDCLIKEQLKPEPLERAIRYAAERQKRMAEAQAKFAAQENQHPRRGRPAGGAPKHQSYAPVVPVAGWAEEANRGENLAAKPAPAPGLIVNFRLHDRQMADAARENERNLLRTLVDHLPDMIYVRDQANRFVVANQAFARRMGAEAADMAGKTDADYYPPEVAARFAAADRRIFAGGALLDHECSVQFPNGEQLTIASTKVPLKNTRGEVIGLVGVIHDVTAQKLAEQKLRESEDKFARMFHSSPVASSLSTVREGRYLDVNAAFLAMFQVAPDQVLGHTVSELNLWVDPGQRTALVALLNDCGVVQGHELELRTKSGQIRQVLWSGALLVVGGESCLLGSAVDITERKQAEQQIMDARNYAQTLLTASPIGIITYQADGSAVSANQAAANLVGTSVENLQRQNFRELDSWREASMLDRAERALATGEEQIFEAHSISSFGKELCLSVRFVPFSYQGQTHLLLLAQDISERKRAEEKVRDSEQRYRQLFELESDALFLVDTKTHRLVDVNQSAEQLYGYGREEFLQLQVEQVSAEPEETRATVDTGSDFVPLRWHRKKNGERFAAEITSRIIQQQGCQMLLTAIRDITPRQRIMEMLQETATQLLEAQRVANLGSYVFDAKTGTWTSSAVLDELFGITDPGFARDVAGWLQLVHPQDRAEMQRHLQEDVLKDHAPFDHLYRVIRPHDQQERWVHGLGKLVLDAAGQVLQMVGVIQDITARKRAEEQINLQISALTATANGIVITDRTGTIEWVNPSFTRITGYPADAAIGQKPSILKSGEQPPAFYAHLWDTILAGKVWHGEFVNRRQDGKLYTEDMTITPVRGADGEIMHFVAIKQDVTERRTLENQLRQAQKMEAIGTLAGGIAHDFNNLLAAMFGFGYLLQLDTKGNAEAQENIGEILRAATRAKDLVQQILTFSRQGEQKRQIIHLDSMVKEAMKFLRASLPSDIKIELALAGDAPAVLADPTQIYQVTMNLATNAQHAMEGRPGRLTVRLEAFRPDDEFLRAHPEFSPVQYARLTVADTGHGMDARTLERMFEPFFTTKPAGRGTGLGLAVVHGIIQSHEGFITVASQVGQGTTFSLYFPAQQPDAAAVGTAPGNYSPGRGQRILLVDDEPALTKSLQQLLLRLNYRVTCCNRAPEAVAWFLANPSGFDLLITDQTMPELNGLEVARQVKAVRPDLPVLLASGYRSTLPPERLRAAGICEVLEKPVAFAALAEAVQRALAGPEVE